jgi:hypothetical protein
MQVKQLFTILTGTLVIGSAITIIKPVLAGSGGNKAVPVKLGVLNSSCSIIRTRNTEQMSADRSIDPKTGKSLISLTYKEVLADKTIRITSKTEEVLPKGEYGQVFAFAETRFNPKDKSLSFIQSCNASSLPIKIQFIEISLNREGYAVRNINIGKVLIIPAGNPLSNMVGGVSTSVVKPKSPVFLGKTETLLDVTATTGSFLKTKASF